MGRLITDRRLLAWLALFTTGLLVRALPARAQPPAEPAAGEAEPAAAPATPAPLPSGDATGPATEAQAPAESATSEAEPATTSEPPARPPEAGAAAAPEPPGSGESEPEVAAPAPAAPPGGRPSEFEQIVVTGTATKVKKLDSSYAISTFNEEDLDVSAPLNTVDLFIQIPGMWAESSGGESGNNVFARGIPQDGSFRYVALYEDGLPLFEEGETSFLNIDTLSRIDVTVERVEAVRGGSSPIFASNAPGGTINLISKKGTDAFAGLARLTVGDYDLFRFESHLSGPITEDLLFSVGGFYRTDDGIRATGFPGNRGGQFRGSLTYLLLDTEITVYSKYLNDHTIFHLPIPLADDKGNSLEDEIDPGKGTLASNDLRLARLRYLDGTPDGTSAMQDLAQGIHPNVFTGGGMVSHDFGGGLMLKEHARYIRGTVAFNALFSLTEPEDAASLLDGDNLTAARAAFGPQVTRLGYRYPDTNETYGGDLVIRSGWWSIMMAIDNFVNDVRLSQSFELAGTHTATAGFYYSDYSLDTAWHFNDVLTEARGRPRRLDIVAYDATGNELGMVTENGFLGYGGFGVNARVNADSLALYAYDEWQLSDSLRFDFGVRHQYTAFSGSVANRTTQDLGDPTTLADDAVGGPDGSFQRVKENHRGTAYSVGANFNVIDGVGILARFTNAYRIPDFENIYFQQGRDTEGILQGEAGLKLDFPALSLFAVGFLSQFDSVSFSDEVVDPDTGELMSLNFDGETQTIGLEAEVELRAGPVLDRLEGLELGVVTTLQSPLYKNVVDLETEVEFDEFVDNQVRRIPKILLAVRPSYRKTVGRVSVILYGDWQYVGDRYVDYGNRTKLPAYSTLNAGIIASLDHRYELQLHGSNLTESTGLTEGNPRVGAIEGQKTEEATFGRPVLGRTFRLALTYNF